MSAPKIPSCRTARGNWLRRAKILYGLGVLLASACSFSFFLGAYGGGGGAESKGVSPGPDRPAPEHSHVLRNHGTVTPISEEYFGLIDRAKEAEFYGYLAALPFLLAGLIAYGVDTWKARGFRRWRLVMWLRLFVPCGSDPLLTAFAKLHLILVFLALIVFDVWTNPGLTEGTYLRVLGATHAVLLAVAALGVSVLRYLRSRRPREAG